MNDKRTRSYHFISCIDPHYYLVTLIYSKNIVLFIYSRQILAQKYPKLAPMVLDEESLTLALNEEYVPTGQVLPLKNGDTVALIPPISGG